MDAETCLINDLEISLRSFRLSALEEAIKSGGSQTLLAALEARLPVETDEECLILLSHAISTVRQRLSGSPALEAAPASPEDFLARFQKANPTERLSLLEALPASLARDLVSRISELLKDEKSPLVQAKIIRTFSRIWPKDQLKELLRYLASGHYNTRLATLEAFIHLAPDFLQRDLPKLLLHKEPRLRTLAIRGLAKIDFEEALTHLEALFDGEARENKIAAIQDCVFFPFDRVKPLLLKLVAVESDIDLLERAGIVLGNNPDPEVPFRLYEIAEGSSQEKKRTVEKLIQQSCYFIEKTKILGEGFNPYLDRLRSWIEQKTVNRWAQDSVNRLSNPEEDAADVEPMIRQHLDNPRFREALTRALEWPIPDAAKEKLKSLLEIPRGETTVQAAGPAEAQKAAPFSELVLDDKIRYLSSLKRGDLDHQPELLQKLFERADTPPGLLASALKAAVKLGIGELAESAKRILKSGDGNLVAAGIEYLGKYDPDYLFTFIGKFLQSENLRIKSAALRILQKNDVKASLTTLKAMLSGKGEEQHKTALSCMVYFEFSLIRSMLLEFLLNKPATDLVKAGLCLFKANPEPDNLFGLFQLEKTLPGETAALSKKIRGENEEFLVKAGLIEATEAKKREEDFTRRHAEYLEKLSKPPASYSLKKLSREAAIESFGDFLKYLRECVSGKSFREVLELVAQSIQDWDETSQFLKKVFSGMVRKYAIPALLLMIGIFVFLLVSDQGDTLSQGTPKEGAILAIPQTVLGKVDLIKKSELHLTARDGKKYIVEKLSGNYPPFEPGKEVKVLLVPYRLTAEGICLANLQTITEP